MSVVLLEMSRWLWDYYLLATVLLAATLTAGRLTKQPARRMAIHWSLSAALLTLALLCAIPGWSIIHLLSAPPEPAPVWEPVDEPLLGTAKQQVPAEAIPQVVAVSPAPLQLDSETAQLKSVPADSLLMVDGGILSLYVILAGAVLLLLWLTLGRWQIYRLRKRAEPAPMELRELLASLTPTGKTQPELGIVDRLQVAVALGLKRPLILLPKNSLDEFDPQKLRTVLAHELAHIHHCDLWLLALLRCLMLLLWAHPFYWLWRRGVRLDQETLADAAAAELSSRDQYAEQLVDWARTAVLANSPRIAASVGLWESPSQLKRRLAVLLDEKLTLLRHCSRRWRVGAMLLIAGLAVSLSLVTLQPESATVAEETAGDKSVETEATEKIAAATKSTGPPSKADTKLTDSLKQINRDVDLNLFEERSTRDVSMEQLRSSDADPRLRFEGDGYKLLDPSKVSTVEAAAEEGGLLNDLFAVKPSGSVAQMVLVPIESNSTVTKADPGGGKWGVEAASDESPSALLMDRDPSEDGKASDVVTPHGVYQVWQKNPGAEDSDAKSAQKISAEEAAPQENLPADRNARAQAMRALMKQLDKHRKPNTMLGICLDENGQPIAGVEIRLFHYYRDGRPVSDKPQQTTTSDKQGFFTFRNVLDVKQEFPNGVPGRMEPTRDQTIVTVVGRRAGLVPGFGSASASMVARGEGRSVWTMLPAKTVKGRVTDEQGNPVVGAQVRSGLAAMSLLGGTRGINSDVTDANGEYVIDDLSAYDLAEEQRMLAEQKKKDPQAIALHLTGGAPTQWVYVKHPDFATRRSQIERIPGSVDVTLTPGCVIEGSMKLPEGEEVNTFPKGSVVRLQRALPPPKVWGAPDPFAYQIEQTTLDENGRYRFQSLPEGKYHLSAEVKGWLTRGVENVEAEVGKVTTAPLILLTRGGRVRIRLLDDATGEPMKFEKPTFGFVNLHQRPSRAAVFSSRENMVEFSINGVGERRALPGNYRVLPSVHLSEGKILTPSTADDSARWPIHEVEEGKLLEVKVRMRAQEPSRASTGTLQIGLPAADADKEKKKEAKTDVFVAATPPAAVASEDKQAHNLLDSFRTRGNQAVHLQKAGEHVKAKQAFEEILANKEFSKREESKVYLSFTQNNLALLLATCPKDELRDGKRAVELAKKSIELFGEPQADMLDTLAAAYAETGDFEKAVETQQQAISLARPEQKKKLQQHLELYRIEKPLRSGAAPSPRLKQGASAPPVFPKYTGIDARLPGRILLAAELEENKGRDLLAMYQTFSLISVEPNKGDWKKLLDIPPGSAYPTISRDGKHSFYMSVTNEGQTVLHVPIGENSQPKVVAERFGQISCNSDGSRLIVSQSDISKRLTETVKRRESTKDKDDSEGDYSLSLEPTPAGHWLTDLETGKEQKIDLPADYQIRDWSPDGKSLVASVLLRTGRNNGDLFLMDIEGKNRQQITNHGSGSSWPRFSNDGKFIVYCFGYQPKGRDVYRSSVRILHLETKEEFELIGYDNQRTNGQTVGNYLWYHYPCWSPDDRWLAMPFEKRLDASDYGSRESGILIVSRDGKRQMELKLAEGAKPAMMPARIHWR